MNIAVVGGAGLERPKMRNSNGTFKRTLEPFSLENFNDGWVDSDGRFRVYFPNHSRADIHGHVLRAIVAYEAYHQITVPIDKDIHHKNGNRLDDSAQNLELLGHKEHAHLSNQARIIDIEKKCKNCGAKFYIKPWRLRDCNRGKFCSRKCNFQWYWKSKKGVVLCA